MQNNQCPGCQGNRMVESSKNGIVQTCPLCSGSGRREPRVNRLPKTYVFGNASQIVLAVSAGAGVAGASSTPSLTIDGQYEFELVFLVASSNPGGTAGAWQDQIADSVPRNWQQAGVFIQSANRWGTAQRPFPVVAQVIFGVREVLTGVFQDMSGAANTIQPCFVGYDLHPDLG